MRTIAISPVVILAILFVGCEKEIVAQRVLRDTDREVAAQFVVKQMETIKVTNRDENEDWDDFLAQAKYNALDIYGIDSIGVWDRTNGFIPYRLCSLEDRNRIDREVLNVMEGK